MSTRKMKEEAGIRISDGVIPFIGREHVKQNGVVYRVKANVPGKAQMIGETTDGSEALLFPHLCTTAMSQCD